MEIVVEELATRLVQQGHEVTCYNRIDKKKDKENIKEYQGIKIIKNLSINIKGIEAATASFFGTIKILFSKNDIVHYHSEGTCVWIWILKLFSHKKVIVTVHGLDWQRAKWGKFASAYIKLGEKCAVKFADELIVLSENAKKYFKEKYNINTNFIPNGVNKPEKKEPQIIKQKYNLDKDEFILFLARIVPEKGLNYLINAYTQIQTEKKLVIAGGASDTQSYYDELIKKNIDNINIIFTGFIQGKELEELYSNAYVYCLPSDIEGMPISLLEAMSYGNCCLTSDIAECKEVIENYGLTFKKSNVEDLKVQLEMLLNNKEIVCKYKENASKFILEKYNWEKVVNNTIKIYEKM